MGKNSNVHKSQAYTSLDLQREREKDAKREARRVRKEALHAERAGEMMVEGGGDSSLEVGAGGEAGAGGDGVRLKRFGKVKRRAKVKLSVAQPVRKSLELKKGSRGIRKPSSIMKKTLKKMAAKRGMELG